MCIEWVRDRPTSPGWYFWRKRQKQSDTMLWHAYYIDVDNIEGEPECWENGTQMCWPAGGWWTLLREDVITRKLPEDILKLAIDIPDPTKYEPLSEYGEAIQVMYTQKNMTYAAIATWLKSHGLDYRTASVNTEHKKWLRRCRGGNA